MDSENTVVTKTDSYIRQTKTLVEYVEGLVDNSVFITDWREYADLENNSAYLRFDLSYSPNKIDELHSSLIDELKESNLKIVIVKCDGNKLYTKPSFDLDIIDYHS